MDDPRPPASPACHAHELQPPAFETQELIGWLNTLLKSERACARGLRDLTGSNAGTTATLLADIARDEGRFCVMLRRHIVRLGGEPSAATGVFYDKLMAREKLQAQLSLLDRGQAALVRTLETSLPRIHDAELVADLDEMLEVHVVNLRRCAELQPEGEPSRA